MPSDPEFLNEAFLKTALEEGLQQKNIKVQKFSVKLATSPGDNYCSVIYRVNISYANDSKNNNEVSVIVKSMLKGDKFFEKFFDAEKEIYQNVIPKMTAVCKSFNIAPKFYYAETTPCYSLVFEDMSSLDYVVADRTKGLDEAHCALILQKLGTFHGISMQMLRDDPTISDRIPNPFNEPDFLEDEMFKEGFLKNIGYLAEISSKWNGYKKISEKLMKLYNGDIASVTYNSIRNKPGDITALNHGDLWTNNILFKYKDDSKTPDDLVFVDYQVCCFSGLGNDIVHFLYTTPYYELLVNKRDYMIKEYYYKSLEATLKQQNYDPIPTYEEVLRDIETREFAGFLWSVVKLPLLCMDKESSKDNSFENIKKADVGQKIREAGFSTERCQSILKYILKRLDNLGVFG